MTPPTGVDLTALPEIVVGARMDRLRTQLDVAHCDAVLVTNLVNIRYLTGFTGSAALLLIEPSGALLVTDGRYREQAAEELDAAGAAVELVVPETLAGQQVAVAARAAGRAWRVGLEAENVSWDAQRRYATDWFPDAELIPTTELIETLRLRKDDAEIARLTAAAAVADAAFAQVRHRLRDRPTESEFAIELDVAMRHLGAEDVSFETIVASGPNGAKPHARPGARRIVEGDLVVLDFGALVEGYHSDMTRTVWVGEPSVRQRRMVEVVAEAQAAGRAAVRAGVAVAEVDRACRDVIDAAGWGDAFVHSTGHGVGLDIHEAPRVAKTSDATLAAGQVVTVEPGVYLSPDGGVRIEDTVVVTDDGCRVLTRTTYSPQA